MTRRRLNLAILIGVVVTAFGGSILGSRMLASKHATTGGGTGGAAQRAPARRIVSLAPSATQILFGVGCGDRVVGATRYCTWPEAAKKVPRIGGYLDPNLEAVVGRRPDLVVTTAIASHRRLREPLRRMGLRVLQVDHGTLAGLLSSFVQIGRACGRPKQAEALAQKLRRKVARIRRLTRGRPRRSVMIVFGRTATDGAIRQVFVAGRTGLYEELIAIAGGVNAYPKQVPAFPRLSLEGVLRLDPDAIVELASDQLRLGQTEASLRRSWEALPILSAVRHGRVKLVTGGYGQVPGPRLIQLLEDLARTLHPEVNWGPK